MRRNNRVYFLKRVPADLIEAARGKRPRILLPATDPHGDPTEVFPKVGTQVSFSLGVSASHPAYERLNAAATEQVLAWFEGLRRGPQRLTHQQKDALVGAAYKFMTTALEADPGLAASEWTKIAARQLHALHAPTLSIGETAAAAEKRERLEGHYGFLLDTVLSRAGLTVTDEDRADLIRRLGRAMPEASLKFSRNADSDYSEDAYAKRFPPASVLPAAKIKASPPASLTWDRLLSNWKTLRNPRESTARDWVKIVRDFASFSGKSDPAAVTRDDVRRWRDHLRDGRGLTLKTINNTHLAGLIAVFNAAVREGLLDTNPASHTSLPTKKSTHTAMQGYTSEDAGQILRASLAETKPLLRWAPWLLAQSGARVGEVCQLRGDDFAEEAGVPFFWIRHETKSGVARRVPLHGELVRQGVLEFARARGARPLFFEPERRRSKRPHKVLVKEVGYWVHTLGLKVGRVEHRKDPNHAWRHWLTTMLRERDVNDYVISAVVGHTDGKMTSRYGTTPLKAMKAALDGLPLRELAQQPQAAEKV